MTRTTFLDVVQLLRAACYLAWNSRNAVDAVVRTETARRAA
jgi:hypothetical protein